MKCPHCPHRTDEHTSLGGCMHRHPTGAACGCTRAGDPATDTNPFAHLEEN